MAGPGHYADEDQRLRSKRPVKKLIEGETERVARREERKNGNLQRPSIKSGQKRGNSKKLHVSSSG